ncbi:MAG TPA: hypothetical protein VK849_11150 [Longimicrobiales bacterium]|nr:hypothetical protein [Longimicrobiales bacterium]
MIRQPRSGVPLVPAALLPVALAPAFLLAVALAAPQPAVAQSPVETALEGLAFREVGPAVMGGRVSDIDAVESNPAVFYVGLATGGVWKTESQGMSWTPLFDDQPCSSIGDVTIFQANPNVVWVGTGEPQNRQSSPYGCGVFRSTDGGRTWTNVGLRETRHVGRIRLHPTDPDVAFVAAVGHLWGPNEERGVYRTRDGGRTWERVLYVDENTGAIDLAIDPGDPNTLFAAMYQRRRTAYGFSASGAGSGLYRTTDGGDTWTELTEGLPAGDKGRIGIDVYRGDGNLVYATVESDPEGRGLYRSRDRGDTWERVSTRNPRPMYFSLVRIDPGNPERIYLGGVSFSASDDGGRTWWEGDAAEGIHVDHHALWIDPSNSSHLILGNDGGIASSWDGARTWRHHNNLAIGQFYEVGADMSDPYRVCGGLQDNSSWCAPNHTLTGYGLRNSDWVDVWGGDGFYNEFDPSDPNVLYTESQGGNSGRLNLATGERWTLRPADRPTDEEPDREYRFSWNAPIVPSQHEPGLVYVGANHLMRSRDRGLTWEEASPDLTRRIDRDTLEIMGAVVTDETLSRNDGVSEYGTITVIEESPLSADVIWVGTDDGNLEVTRDGGETWTDVVSAVRGLPGRSYVSRIEASAHAEGRVYATFDRHYDDDYRPYVFVSEDYGGSWRSISAGLPDESVNAIREHPASADLLFLGNEIGVFVSVDRGAAWQRMRNLPTVPVDDILIHPRDDDLILGTHGRSIWILDDLAPLVQMAEGAVLDGGAVLFPVPTATQWFRTGGWPFWGDLYEAPAPEDGAVIRYRVGRDQEGEAALTIATAMGETVRELEGPARAGLHEVAWDMRETPPVEPGEEGEEGGGGFGGGAPRGALVLPGTYRVRLEVGGEVAEQEVTVRLDPRVQADRVALEARQAAAREAAILQGSVTRAQRALRHLDEIVSEAARLLDDVGADEALKSEADAIAEELDSLRSDLQDASVGRVANGLERNAGPPTGDELRAIERAWSEVPELVERINGYVTERVPGLHRRMNDAGVRPDPGEPVPVPRRPGG